MNILTLNECNLVAGGFQSRMTTQHQNTVTAMRQDRTGVMKLHSLGGGGHYTPGQPVGGGNISWNYTGGGHRIH